MKKVIFICILVLGVCSAAADSLPPAPVGVSPGGWNGAAVIVSSCPTFSWSSVEWAVGYRVEVFKAQDDSTDHGEMAQRGELVLRVDIPAPALSWSASGNDALQTGESYVWFVRAFDSKAEGQWSLGNRFMVDVSVALAGMDEALKDRVRDYVRRDSEIRSAIREIYLESGDRSKGAVVAAASGENPSGETLKGLEGTANTFYGLDAGLSITSHPANTGSNNTFVGASAGKATTTGNDNTFLGQSSGQSNVSGTQNTFIGVESGYNNNEGTGNTFLGYYAGHSNVSGGTNTFLGIFAGHGNTSGSDNTFIGKSSGVKNTEGLRNTFVGNFSGFENVKGEYNSFLGDMAGKNNTYGSSNTFMGEAAGLNNNGSDNVFLGRVSGANNTGSGNVFLGKSAGQGNQNGNYNVFIGYQAGYNDNGSSRLYIHNSNSSSPLIYGEFFNRSVKINGSLIISDLASPSDISLKKDIRPLEDSLGKVTNLKGVAFKWRTEENPDRGFSNERQIGLIAQDVEKVLPELVRTGKDGKKSLSYDKLTVVLVEAVKAQQARMEAQNSEIAAQNQRLSAQEAQIEELKTLVKQLSSKIL
ncbi:MAG: hypothetical protein COZ70_09305 [Deltaproteobacteria bacterium CG_4_8_14_3_um_filter_51_11]|nr:hypothetical protein [bacterium]OIP37479.1 MAG: hypothetical protein AUK25_14845 [Desulfobacteraceae bacterium CG2_30_51_40]PIP48536.1 MAG: hypothetical protein COX16_00850 [Deltaproteobacteria bacterium CG23_combo_of_CG06-09_8_20_14_all_51_20]PIX19392.1 MAG: hypothetical protein COZ70_09305 [Deltaproteobacteria bacterium CG_4_8_14_3_um_filter_51_11]PJB37696.1 MAG: hypothetical protein CO107_04055 [Deltaproteobacteria bacterium CG_4_9_14_3_um_filter_51_14]